MKGFSSAPQISPALMADAGIMLGSTPGAKFFIGPTLYAWFPLSSVTPTGTNGGPSVLASGTSIAVGGMIGVFFGS
jgi:hypothetical protein